MSRISAKMLWFLLAGAVMPLAGADRGNGQGAAEFKVGVVLPLTGAVAANGRYELTGAYVGADMANNSGGIGGLPVRLIVCDTQSLEQQAVICAKRLASEDKVNLLLGAGNTPQTMAILQTAEAAGIPLFTLAGAAQPYTPQRKWAFKGHFGNDDFVPALLDYLKRKGWKRVALIRDTGPYGSDVFAQLSKIIDGSGVEIVLNEQYAPTDTDMSAQITRIRAVRPDAIVNFAPTEQTGATISKKIVQLGIAAPIIIGPNLQTDTFLKLAGDTLDNMVFVTSKVVLDTIPADDPSAAIIKDFKANFAKRYPNETALSLSVVPADGIILAQQAGKMLGKDVLDSEKLRAQIEKSVKVPGVQGQWTFSEASHGTSLKDGITAARVSKGKWTAD